MVIKTIIKQASLLINALLNRSVNVGEEINDDELKAMQGIFQLGFIKEHIEKIEIEMFQVNKYVLFMDSDGTPIPSIVRDVDTINGKYALDFVDNNGRIKINDRQKRIIYNPNNLKDCYRYKKSGFNNTHTEDCAIIVDYRNVKDMNENHWYYFIDSCGRIHHQHIYNGKHLLHKKFGNAFETYGEADICKQALKNFMTGPALSEYSEACISKNAMKSVMGKNCPTDNLIDDEDKEI